ncbi:MAG: alpha-D-ribose 1-methylphosphonate 5-triphosphate diphosphatase [Caldimicrobium sp.]|nr:alpha-D-ribose 1-methylphosphonate 5-triphosphate diphosphatase [Caldimicrobium sp.]MCX7874238.1 alpha-D-ribose 1-methylphosphonate 5-triphosphate diphosphatase [Caldimicrobium sp.]MDW8094767.1 alpha-D-ribose 1-methylphosphonate 5-triphosphate diphosphatase [Caldimicrobium sp.]
MKKRDLIIENAKVVLPDRVLESASIKIEDGIIADIQEGTFNNPKNRFDASGYLVIPGFVDIHCDALEKEIEPRPNVLFPEDIALVELDKKLSACGITTIYHSVSFAEGELGLRCNKTAKRIVEEIIRMKGNLNTRTMVHCRYEITNTEALPIIEEMLKKGFIDLLSFMDHTPGQGQFRDILSYKNFFGGVYGKSEEELMILISRKFSVRNEAIENIFYLSSLCLKLGIPMASHDDDSEEKIELIKNLEIRISEFPVNKRAARAARDKGIFVCVGAPNVLRGVSQVNNLSAREAISEGLANILCSDYSPMTFIHSIFKLYELNILPLHEAINMATLYPAQAVGISDRVGSIEVGKEADLIIVDYKRNIKRIIKTFRAGIEVFSSCGIC